jgi:hypothetical protein
MILLSKFYIFRFRILLKVLLYYCYYFDINIIIESECSDGIEGCEGPTEDHE